MNDFEKHISRYESINQCLLLEDLDGKRRDLNLGTEKLIVHSQGMQFEASVRDFYVNNKFKPGIFFSHKEGAMSEFFFECSVSEGKRARIIWDPNAPLTDGRAPVEIEIFVVSKN